MNCKAVVATIGFVLCILPAGLGAQSAATANPDPLLSGFVNPPSSARPRVWWHWMNGNITKEGIQAGPGMDAPRGDCRIPELRRGAGYTAGCR